VIKYELFYNQSHAKMKKIALAFLATLFINSLHAGETGSLSGMVVTNETVISNNFTYPKNIHTKYYANDQSQNAVLIAYTTLYKIGSNSLSVEIKDKNGNKVDECKFKTINVTEAPWTHTISCDWGGRQPSGGLTFNIMNTYSGKKEKLGELYLSEVK